MANDIKGVLAKTNSILQDPAIQNVGTTAGIIALAENHMEDLKGLGLNATTLVPLLLLASAFFAGANDETSNTKAVAAKAKKNARK